MTDRDHQSIMRWSRLLRGVCLGVVLLVPVAFAALWAFGDEHFLLSGEPVEYGVPHGVAFEPGRLGVGLRLAGFAISMIPGGLVAWAAWQLAGLFGEFARMNFFTTDTVRRLRLFEVAVLATGLARPFAGALMSLATSVGNVPGNRHVSITAGDGELTAILLGAVLLVVARVMEQGRRLAEEHEQIV
jgi:hypothetical protein